MSIWYKAGLILCYKFAHDRFDPIRYDFSYHFR